MLSDEEKKAIEYWKTHMEILHWNTQLASEHYIKVLLNLIEKKSKEIEELKEKRENQKKELAILNAKQVEFNKLVNTVNSYKGQFKRQQKEIEELEITSNELNGLADVVIRDYIHKDKIKAKIEEIDNEYSSKILSNEKMSLDLVNINTQRHNAMKLVLEELLKKE